MAPARLYAPPIELPADAGPWWPSGNPHQMDSWRDEEREGDLCSPHVCSNSWAEVLGAKVLGAPCELLAVGMGMAGPTLPVGQASAL